MRIQVRIPKVKPDVYREIQVCPYEGCGGQCFKEHGQRAEAKPTRDLNYAAVESFRYQCLKCGRTFRVYPEGVSRAQQSDGLKAMSVILYVLGLSYGAVADFLEALGQGLGKTTVYRNVQAAGFASRQRQRQTVDEQVARPVIGTDGTYVKVKGVKVGLQVVVDDANDDLLGLDLIVSERAEEVIDLVRDIAVQVEAEVLITDDLDSYKAVADELGLDHQICRSHVKRNVDELAQNLHDQLKQAEPVPPGVSSSPEQLDADLQTLQRLVRERPADARQQLERLYHRYQAAPVPTRKGQRHTVWYRMRMLVTRLWERWPRLTLDQRRSDLDGTNNGSERVIGWWIKERYRTMRGYKRPESIRNVVTLTARMGVRSGRYDMAELYQ
jgi:transposase-like protein